MGRKPWSTRPIVEHYVCLDARDMHRAGVFREAPGSHWLLKYRSGVQGFALAYTVVATAGHAMGLQFEDGHSTPYVVNVTTTRPRFGGLRHWLRCPMLHDGIACGRRVARLYAPPGMTRWGCRLCHDLTYSSSRRHDARKDKLRRDPLALAMALRDPKLRRLALDTLASW